MIHSMTGFASTTRELSTAALNVELRSVNHRYLDLQFRLPEELRALEPGLRELIVARLQRGKIECRIGLNPLADAQKSLDLNSDVLKQLRALSEKLRLAWPSVPGLTAAEILRWPGILGLKRCRSTRRAPYVTKRCNRCSKNSLRRARARARS
jgi:uncharacterized protein (TIGR00255 family)